MSFIDLFDAAAGIQDFCDARGWRSCFIGGIAVQRWSQARVTLDVDLTLLTGFGHEESFLQVLLAHYTPRIANATHFALRSRVLLLNSPGGIGIDISLGALAFEHLVVQRATPFEFAPGLELRTCSAEDLMVMKLLSSGNSPVSADSEKISSASDARGSTTIFPNHDEHADGWKCSLLAGLRPDAHAGPVAVRSRLQTALRCLPRAGPPPDPRPRHSIAHVLGADPSLA
jgi:hypothetical protein